MKMKTIKIYRHKHSLIPKGIGLLGVGLVLGVVIGSDILLDKVITLIVRYLGWMYPSFVLNYISAYDLTLIVIFSIATILIFGGNGNGNGGKK